jgi:isopentenyl-diphosphate delta-isomerase
MNHDEILDLVDETDKVIGTISRSNANVLTSGKLYIRAADMYIVNDKGELWVPKRTENKVIAPGGLDFSVGGHVETGENYLSTILRETEEELNLQLTPEDVVLIDIIRRDDTQYFSALYLHRSNTEPQFNPDDFVSAEWLSPEALIQKIDSGTPAKGNVRFAVETLIKSQVYQNLIS